MTALLLILAATLVPPGAGGPVCGDGSVDPGETCDPPEPDSEAPDRCRSDCRSCGDGVFDFAFEACDDGNNTAGDGCESDCHIPTYVALTGNDTTGDGSPGNPYRTIQRAFDRAGSFYTILVGPGTYNECVTAAPPVAADRPVKIVAEAWLDSGDNAATIVTGDGVCDAGQGTQNRKPVIEVRSRGSRVEGFTITGGGASGIVGAGNVVITNNVIADNRSTLGGGVYLDLTATAAAGYKAVIRGNAITGNRAEFGIPPGAGGFTGGDGGGVFVSAVGVGGDVDVLIDGNSILDNTIGEDSSQTAVNVHGGGLGVFTNSSTAAAVRVAITNNTIAGNRVDTGAQGYSGGAWIYTFGYGSETIDVVGNTFQDNRAELDGGGLSAWISTDGTRGDADVQTPDSDIRHTINVTDNLFLNNRGSGGGGLDLFVFAQNLKDDERAQLNVAGNTVTGNTATGLGGFGGGGGGALVAMTSWRSATPETWIRLEQNSLRANITATSGGGVGIVTQADADPPNDTTVPLPPPAFAVSRIDLVGNLIADNDASTVDAGGGGVFAYLQAFVNGTSTLNVDRSTIAGNTADFGAGGLHVEVFTGFDTLPADVARTELNLANSIVAANELIGVGGPIPGVDFGILSGPDDNTGRIDVNVAYSDVFGHPGGNYDVWFQNPTGTGGNISRAPLFGNEWIPGACSPTLDAADPALDFSLEPPPNGGRANMGHTGGTALATAGPPDPSGDGSVDGVDLLKLSVAFGTALGAQRYDAAADIDGDGVVDGVDLALVAGSFGTSCTP